MSLYVSDLDGTLLDRSGQLSGATRAGLIRLLDEGLVFTVASARHVLSIQRLLEGLPLRLPVISSNGAYLSDMASARHELVHAMAPELGQALLALVRRHGLSPFCATHGPKGDQLFWQDTHNAGQQAFVDERIANGDPRLRRSPRLEQELRDPLVTLVVVDRHGPLAALQAEIEALCGEAVQTHLNEDLYLPEWPWLTVHDRRATKDQAIHTLAQRYGLAEREIVVFGDHINDVSMMRAAHRGIAMGNAIEAVKQAARQVIGPNHEDSVLRFLESDWRRGA